MNTTAHLKDLKSRRRFVRVIVVVGILASITANVLGAEDLIAAGIAGWPPVALLLSLEVLTRVPTSRRLGAFGRVVATIGVAFAAGWLSYWHMAATVSQHGETGGSQYVWPISVDGLMTISAIALVELGARIRQIEAQQVPQAPAAVETAALERAYRMPSAPVSPAPSEDPAAVAFRAAMKRKRPVAA